MDYQQELYRQLERDYSLTPGTMPLRENLFVRKNFTEGRRIYSNDRCLLQVLAIDGCAVFACADDGLLDWCREQFEKTNGAWMCEVGKLFALNDKLKTLGHFVADAHSYYIPEENTFTDGDAASDAAMLPEGVTAVWHERDEMLQFFGDKRFFNAVTGSDLVRDMLCVAAMKDGEAVGLAGVSADSPTAWQIGIDVLPAWRHLGIGTALTRMLAREVAARGYLPFYGTGESHIGSRRVAHGAGFRPAWWELYTKKLPTEKERQQ